MNGDEPEMRVKAGCRYMTGRAKPFTILFHQLQNLDQVQKYDGGTGDAVGKRSVDAADFRLAAEHKAPVQFAPSVFIDGSIFLFFLPPIRASTTRHRSVNGFKIIAHRLAATVGRVR